MGFFIGFPSYKCWVLYKVANKLYLIMQKIIRYQLHIGISLMVIGLIGIIINVIYNPNPRTVMPWLYSIIPWAIGAILVWLVIMKHLINRYKTN